MCGRKKARLKALKEEEYLVGLVREFADVCKSSIAEGMEPAKNVGRHKRLLTVVSKVHKLAFSGDMWQIFEETSRIMTRRYSRRIGTVHCKTDARSKTTKAGTQKCFMKPLSKKLCVSAEGNQDATSSHSTKRPARRGLAVLESQKRMLKMRLEL